MSNPLGKGTRNLSVNIPVDLFIEIRRLASLSGFPPGAYVRALLEHAKARELLVRKNIADEMALLDAIKAGISPLPKVRLEVVDPAESHLRSLRVAEEPAQYHAKPKTK